MIVFKIRPYTTKNFVLQARVNDSLRQIDPPASELERRLLWPTPGPDHDWVKTREEDNHAVCLDDSNFNPLGKQPMNPQTGVAFSKKGYVNGFRDTKHHATWGREYSFIPESTGHLC